MAEIGGNQDTVKMSSVKKCAAVCLGNFVES